MTNYYLLDRIAGRDASLRAADADRERLAERLREAHAEGRLDLAEFQERLERCYGAKTLGELSQLVSDLPRQQQPAERRSFIRLLPFRPRLMPFIPILLALIVVAAAAGHHLFWLWIPLAFLIWRMSWWRRRRVWQAGRRAPGGWM